MITVNSTCIEISDYKLGDCPKLEKILSVWDPGVFANVWAAYLYNEDKEVLTIPRGMSLNYVQYLLNRKDEVIYSTPMTSKLSIFKCNTEPRDEKQRESIEFLMKPNPQKMLCLKTGGGKTFCTINALSKKRVRSIILVDQEKIMNQWKDEIIKFTNLEEQDLFFISGSDSVDKLLSTPDKDINYKIYIGSHRTLYSYGNREGWDKVSLLFEKLKIGVKVYDEAHVEMKNIFSIDSNTNVKENIYLTATPGRSSREEDKVYQNMIKSIPKHGLEEKFENNYHNIFYISYNSNPTFAEENKCQNKYGFNSNAFSDYIFDNEEKLDKFLEVMDTLLKLTMKSNNKTAIVIHKLDHVKILKKKLEEMYPDVEVGTFCTLVKDLKKREEELEKKLIISTDKSLGKAVNIPNLQYLIMTVPTSSKIVSEQTLGRLRNIEGKKVCYFDVTDIGFESCVRQRSMRKSLLDKKAVAVKTLKL